MIDTDSFATSTIDSTRWPTVWASSGSNTTSIAAGELVMDGVGGANCGVMTAAGYASSNITYNVKIKMVGDGSAFLRLYTNANNLISFGPIKSGGSDDLAYFLVKSAGIDVTTLSLSGTTVDAAYHTYTMKVGTVSIALYMDGTYLTTVNTPSAISSYQVSLVTADMVTHTSYFDNYSAISDSATAYSLADEVLSSGLLPEFTAYTQSGENGFTVELSCNGAFTTNQIASCVMGTPTSIAVTINSGSTEYTGVVSGFTTRSGYSMVQLKNAVCDFI